MANCQDCNSTPNNHFSIQSVFSSTSNCESSDCEQSADTKCITYSGANLSCSGINSGDTLEDAFQKIDNKLCTTLGNYASYNMACLDDTGGAITTEQQFVERISTYVCNLSAQVNSFINTTFTNYQTTVNNRFNAIETPGITSCSFINLQLGDSLQTVITKLKNAICSIHDQGLIQLNGVEWNQCFSASVPLTVPSAFNLIIDQICELKASIGSGGGSGTLPTFNNTGSCLPTPGSADSLESTVNKIKIRLCQTPTFDINSLTWNCIAKPSPVTTNLQAAFQAVLTKIDTLAASIPTFDSGDFSVTNVDNSQPCLGKRVELAVPSDQDRFVAINDSDTVPGTLINKLAPGSGLSFDLIANPGKITLNSTTGADENVKSHSADPSAGKLIDKIKGGNGNGISIAESVDFGANKVQMIPSVNALELIQYLYTEASNNPTTKAALCQLLSLCDCCSAPVQVNVTGACGQAGFCSSYYITNGTGVSRLLTFTDCHGNNFALNLAPGESTTICALQLINYTSLTIVNNGYCGALTTSSTTSTSTTTP